MTQSVWHRTDIENVLRGVELSCQQMAAQFDDPEVDSYRRGFLAALAATATSFGIQVGMPFSAPPFPSSMSGVSSNQARRPPLPLAARPDR
jgi:hypothetical protein